MAILQQFREESTNAIADPSGENAGRTDGLEVEICFWTF
jgi:hypothetical protein